MKIRSITCFYDPGAMHSDAAFDRLKEFCDDAQLALQENGYEVQSRRLATTPFPQMLPTCCDQSALFLIQKLEKKALEARFGYLSVGPALMEEPESYRMIPTLLAETSHTFYSGMIANYRDGVDLSAVRACSQIIQQAAQIEPDGFANLRFSALAHVSPFGPFFPGAYHQKGQPPSVAFAIEAGDEVVAAFAEAGSFQEARQNLLDRLERHANNIGGLVSDLLAGSEIVFQGFDFSVAPFPAPERSLGQALESIGINRLGLHGSLAAAAFLAETLDRGDWPRCGFNGLMLPLLEDAILSQRSIDRTLGVKDLLMYSAVCGTGLDTIPLAGDVTAGQIEALLVDIAFLATRLKKPLTARLMPVPGKSAGEMTGFDFEFFANGRILSLDAEPLGGYFQESNEKVALVTRAESNQITHTLDFD